MFGQNSTGHLMVHVRTIMVLFVGIALGLSLGGPIIVDAIHQAFTFPKGNSTECVSIANKYMQMGKVTKAKALFEAAVRYDSLCLDGYWGLARLAVRERRYSDAIQQFSLAIKAAEATIFSEDRIARLYNGRARCFLELAQQNPDAPSSYLRAAIRDVDLACAIAQNDSRILIRSQVMRVEIELCMEALAKKRGDLKKAEESSLRAKELLKDAIASRPNSPEVNAFLRMHGNDLDQRMELFK